jgi:hypothetical protein
VADCSGLVVWHDTRLLPTALRLLSCQRKRETNGHSPFGVAPRAAVSRKRQAIPLHSANLAPALIYKRPSLVPAARRPWTSKGLSNGLTRSRSRLPVAVDGTCAPRTAPGTRSRRVFAIHPHRMTGSSLPFSLHYHPRPGISSHRPCERDDRNCAFRSLAA